MLPEISMTELQMLDHITKDGKAVPEHIAIIMDGNRRWSRERGKPFFAGHAAGADVLREICKACIKAGVKILTVYAFSVENWHRSDIEVKLLLRLFKRFAVKERESLLENKVKLNIIGNLITLPLSLQKELCKTADMTGDNKSLLLNLAMNYGSRNEILQAVKEIAIMVEEKKISSEEVDCNLISSLLYTGGMPDPDLLIRTSGELRLSNFLLWQMAYTEFWFTEKYWPDFRPFDLYTAIGVYQDRNRRFGGSGLEI
jgi:undecaprenyl diphosphate synthase